MQIRNRKSVQSVAGVRASAPRPTALAALLLACALSTPIAIATVVAALLS